MFSPKEVIKEEEKKILIFVAVLFRVNGRDKIDADPECDFSYIIPVLHCFLFLFWIFSEYACKSTFATSSRDTQTHDYNVRKLVLKAQNLPWQNCMMERCYLIWCLNRNLLHNNLALLASVLYIEHVGERILCLLSVCNTLGRFEENKICISYSRPHYC